MCPWVWEDCLANGNIADPPVVGQPEIKFAIVFRNKFIVYMLLFSYTGFDFLVVNDSRATTIPVVKSCRHMKLWCPVHLTSNFISSRVVRYHFSFRVTSLYPPKRSLGGGILDSPCSSVRLSVCPSVRPSVRPSVGRCPDDNSNSFQWI